jgi:hypothetical protein
MIMEKMDVRSLAELILIAERLGLLGGVSHTSGPMACAEMPF